MKNFQFSRVSRRLGSGHDDLVTVYHTGSWQNVLTSDLLVDICLTEKKFLSELSGCLGSDESSMITLIFDSSCQYRTSYEESLYLFGLEQNSQYVENNVDPSDPTSHILISYLSVACSLSLNQVNNAIDKSTVGHIHINYAQTDLIMDAFLSSGLHDLKLSVIAVIVCFVILSVSLNFNFFFATITIICILFSLIISVGLLPAFGYDYFSAFNVLAIFVITGVGSDAILIFISAWQKYYDQQDLEQTLEFVLFTSYRSTAPALIFTVSTTVLSFMSNLVSPIIVVSQLGAFMGSSMMLYFIFLHLIAIPSWLSIVRIKKYLSYSLRRYHQRRFGAAIDNSSSLLIPEDTSESVGAENSNFDDCLMALSKGFLWCLGEDAGDQSQCLEPLSRMTNIFVEGGASDSVKQYRGPTSLDDTAVSIGSNTVSMTDNNVQGFHCRPESCDYSTEDNEVTTIPDSAVSEIARLSTNRSNSHQSLWLGCGGLLSVLLALLGILLLLFSIVQTDWGLPLIFPKKDNISGLMYVAVHYKPDILSLSSDGESNNPPIVVHEPTHAPTNSPPTRFPTLFSTTSSPTFFPSLSPSLVTNNPTKYPTHAPTNPTSSNKVDYTDYSVDICYGLNIKTHSIDSDATAKFDAESFGEYVESKFLSDTQQFCDYLADNRKKMELQTPDSDCLYYSLMAVSSDDISIYDRIYLWMVEDTARYRYVGAEVPDNKTEGNFGKKKTLLLTWICQPLECRANVSSFFDDPNHAIKMIDRWDHALYDKGDSGASSMGVSTLTSSDAWLFPVLSASLVQALFQSSMISFVGCLCLLLLSTWNMKLVLLIGMSMFFIIVISLTAHALSFSNTINLIDVVVLISFIGIIIDYPTHMAFHYQHDMSLADERDTITSAHSMHRNSFNFMRKTLLGPALTTICAAIPLLFAEFTLISKAGEYVVILTLATYIFVAIVMPTILRLEQEFIFLPPSLLSKFRSKFQVI